MKSIANLRELLKEKGLSYTRPRRLIVSLMTNEHGPFTAEEIYSKIGKSNCDLATVYRTLTQFVDANLISKCHFPEEITRYEWQDDHHHHHVICKKCKNIESFKFCFMSEVEKLLHEKGYRDLGHQLEFLGICPQCL